MTDNPTYDELQQRIRELETRLNDNEVIKNRLNDSQALNYALFNRINDCVFICDPLGNFLDANQAALNLLGYQRSDIANLNFADIVKPDDLPGVFERTRDTIEHGYQPELIELELTKKNGEKVTVESVSSVIYKDKKPEALLGIARDISIRKKNEIALQESEEKFRLLSEQSLMAIGIYQDNQFKYVNQAFADIFGHAREDILSWTINDIMSIIHPGDRDFVLNEGIKNIDRKPGMISSFSCRITTRSAKVRWIDQYSKVILFDGKPANFFTAIDITKRMEAEMALKESEERHRLVTEYATDIIWVRETDENFSVGPFTFISPSVERLRGFTVEEAKTLPLEKSMPKESIEIAFKALYDELEKEYHEHMDRNRSRTIEVELYCKDGSKKWFEITIRIIRDTKSKPIYILGISRDISERRDLQKQALESAKMAALGGLVAGVAHEINTPVGVSITASTYMSDLVEKLDRIIGNKEIDAEKSQHALNKIKETSAIIHRNLQHAVEIISSFKQVAVDQSTEGWRCFNLKNTIEEILVNLEPSLKQTKHNISINCSEKHVIYSSPGAFFQIITNLIMNSLMHGFENNEHGNILIEVSERGSHLLFLYSDDGCGMENHILDRIFDPFFTTKRGQGGTGLGLHIVYNLVTQTLGGTIKCKSKSGKGADFYITIPLQEKTLPLDQLSYSHFKNQQEST